MNNRTFSKLLETRTKKFAVSIIRLSASLGRSTEIRVIRYQLTKSGTSIGANYREANRARSNADFYHKIKICETESNETIYWLELVKEVCPAESSNAEPLITEADELLALFTSIGKNRNKRK